MNIQTIFFETRHSEAQQQWDCAAQLDVYEPHFGFEEQGTPNYSEGIPIDCSNQVSETPVRSHLFGWKWMTGLQAYDAIFTFTRNTSMNPPRSLLIQAMLRSLLDTHGHALVRVVTLTTY